MSVSSTPENRPVGFIRQFELVDRVRAYDAQVDEALLNQAYVFSMKAHGDQKRKNGDPYFTHPLAVAAILTELKADPQTVATALLHDVVEDTEVTVAEIEDLFGPDIAKMVDGVTKISQRELSSVEMKQAENFRKFIIAVSQDVRVLLVKLADRLHNMRTLEFHDKPGAQKRIALETMEIYAPLAGRIGVQRFRDELEELSFQYLNPDGYETITENLTRLTENAVQSVVHFSTQLRDLLANQGVKAEIVSREKKPFSIWRKMQRKGHSFHDLADIYGFRVIVDTVEECYQALGVIHQNFRMIPIEFDDYISAPKPNNYRSIHTAVLAPLALDQTQQKVEVQIRTREMHETAERGIAAHWKYKDPNSKVIGGGKVVIAAPTGHDPYEWARGAVDVLTQGGDAGEFLADAKAELYADQVYCFTPKGRVIALPEEATPIDFAYAVHTHVGDECVGARINGANRPLRSILRNGDIVDILRSKKAPIPNNWEAMIVTNRARNGIRGRIKKLKTKEQIEIGKRLLEADFKAHDLIFTTKAIKPAQTALDLKSVNEVLAQVGQSILSARHVREAAFPGVPSAADRDIEHIPMMPRNVILLDGLTAGVSVHLSKCCVPLPGERIIGLPSENGMDVHRIDCDALATTKIDEQDWLDLRWRQDTPSDFPAPIRVQVSNHTGAIGHVGTTIARYDANILDFHLDNRESDFSDLVIDITVKDARHLQNVLTALRATEYVVAAERRREALAKVTP